MKILVTGGSGLLGRDLCKKLRETEHTVVATACSRVKGALIKCDLEDPQQVCVHEATKTTLCRDNSFSVLDCHFHGNLD